MSQVAAATWAFPPDPSSSREARHRVSSLLAARHLDAAVFPVLQVVSELVTNAVLHARTPFEVRLLLTARHIRIEVHDRLRRLPTRRYFSEQATSGRGLQLVEQLSDAWGVEPDRDGDGKTVWAEVPADGPGPSFDFDSVEDL